MSEKPEIKIKKIPIEDCPKTSADFGYVYEDILKKKSLRYIKGLKSIYDPGIFNRSGRNIKAVKAFIIKGMNKEEIKINFKESIKNNDFIIFPYINYGFDFSVDKHNYQLYINEKEITVYKYNPEKKSKRSIIESFPEYYNYYFFYKNEKYYLQDFKLDKLSCWQINILDENTFIFVYKIELEIDGLFQAEEEININQFSAEEYYIFTKENNRNKHIKNIIYEVKSGNDFYNLSVQIKRDYYFFKKFFEVYPNYNIDEFAIFGFLRSHKSINSFLSLYNEEKEKLFDIPIPIFIFRYNENLFGENIYFENSELSEIGEIKYQVIVNTEKIDKLEENINKSITTLGNKFEEKTTKVEENLNKNIQSLENKFKENLNKNIQSLENKFEENLNKNIQSLENKFDGKIQGIKDILVSLQNSIKSKNESNIPSYPNYPPFLYPPPLFQNNSNDNNPNGVPYPYPGYIITPIQLFQGNTNSAQDS